MKLVLDHREHDLIAKLQGISVQHTIENLPLGDIAIQTDAGDLVVLIERKTFADLFASLKDGRYEEQSHRLVHASGLSTHNIVYVLEGVVSQMLPKDKQLLYSCITSINLYKGFSVMRTASVSETADWIAGLFSKIENNFSKGKQLYFTKTDLEGGQPSAVVASSYTSVVKKVKKDNIHSENIGAIMLCQIPGISSKTAEAIMEKYGGSFPKLIEEIRTNPACLNDVKTMDGNGKTRKISSACSDTIIRFFA